jgi:hypothetical protein
LLGAFLTLRQFGNKQRKNGGAAVIAIKAEGTATVTKTREQIIHSMCMTWRHDYGLINNNKTFPFEAGMADREREILFSQMAQIFDNDIAPYMKLKREYRPKRTKEEKQLRSELGYARVGADTFRRGK